MIIKTYKLMRDLYKRINENAISAHASSAAFFIFLSLIPGLLLVSAIIPYTSVSEADLMTFMIEIVPKTLVPFVISIISEVYDQSLTIISFAAIIVIWSASKGILAIMKALNAINNVNETRNYFILRFWASIYTLILLVMVIASLIIMVFGNILVDILLKDIPNLKYLFEFILSFRFMLVWIILAVFFMVLYTYIPNKKLSFITQFPGAILASVVWSVFSWGFSMYVEYFNVFDIYGSLSTIAMLMLWLYICMYILLLGAIINRYYRQVIISLHKN